MKTMRFILITVAVAGLAGCQTLPDVQPFTDATAGLRSAVASTGTTVVAEMKQTPLAGVTLEAKNLETAWRARNAAMSALVAYSLSAQAIIDSGKKGEESAKKLAEAAKTLAGTIGAGNLLVGATGSLVADTASTVYDQIASARAAKSLAEALTAMQPAINRIAQLLSEDLSKCDEIVTLANKARLDALEEDNQREIKYRQQLLKTRGELMSAVKSELEENQKPSELTRSEDLARISDLLAKTDAWSAEYEAKQSAITTHGRAAHELIAATAQALPDWAAAHAKLQVAVAAKRSPTLAELTEATTRIRELVDRYRKL